MDEPDNSACPWCGSNDTEFWCHGEDIEYCTSDQRYEYRACHDCDILFLKSPPVDQLNLIYPTDYYSYSKKKKGLLQSIKSVLDRRLYQRILNEISADELSVLDVGGGSGQALDVIRALDHRVTRTKVVDLDDAAEELAREAGHEYHVGAIQDFETTERFDLVLMQNLIEHVEAPWALLESVGELLKPAGRVIIKTPNIECFEARIFKDGTWGGYHCPRHWVLLSGKSMTEMARRAGYGIDTLRFTQGAPFWAISILDLLAKMGLIAKPSRAKPFRRHILYQPLCAIAAGFDFMRKPFAKLSQMIVVLHKHETKA